MKKLYRNFTRVWKTGATKSMRMMHIFLPLVFFFALIISFSGSFFFAYGMVNHLIQDFQSKLNIVVKLDRRINQEYIDKVVNDIGYNNKVSQIEFKSANQELEEFKQNHKNKPQDMEALAEVGTNPFGPAVVVFAKDPSNYKELASDFLKLNTKYSDSSVDVIESTSYEKNENAINKFAKMLKIGEIIFAITMILSSFVLLLNVYLVLRFATESDKDEIKVMKLVGAPTMLMVGPTTVMGILAGFFGSLIALFVLYFLAREITPYTLSFGGFNVLTWYISRIQYFIIFTVSFGVIIGFFGSLLAIRRHL